MAAKNEVGRRVADEVGLETVAAHEEVPNLTKRVTKFYDIPLSALGAKA